MEKNLTIGSWNINWWYRKQSLDSSKWDYLDIDYFISECVNLNYDIYCIQEAHINDTYNQIEIIAKKLWYYFTYKILSPSHINEAMNLSLWIISRYPLLNIESYILPNPILGNTPHDKWFLKSDIVVWDESMTIITGHLTPFHAFWRSAFDEEYSEIQTSIIEYLSKYNAKKIIINWDFNCYDFDRYIGNTLSQKNLITITENNLITTPSGRPFDKIVIGNLKYKNLEIHKSLADHHLINIEVTL